MASKVLLVVIGVAVVSVVASAAPPAQPPRIQADVVVMGYLQCAGDAVAAVAAGSATTDGNGWFRMAMNTTAALSSVASGCSLVVTTPLATCDAALPATGTLQSGLRLLVSMVFFPRGFSYVV
uniref:Uncharacterized protein n=1 Tax=Oryza glumipatula TaxID=40148 RepID=A0A0E0AP79_9ORYZ